MGAGTRRDERRAGARRALPGGASHHAARAVSETENAPRVSLERGGQSGQPPGGDVGADRPARDAQRLRPGGAQHPS